MTTGERIRLIRKENHMNQTEFAKEISLSTTSVCQLECGKYQMARTTKRIICSRFRINPEWLETGEGEMHAVKCDASGMAEDIVKVLEENPAICRFAETMFRLFGEKEWKTLNSFLLWANKSDSGVIE